MGTFIKYIISICAVTITFGLVGCNNGTAENAGEHVDNAVEQTKETTQDAWENTKDAVTPDGPAENAGEKVDNMTN